MINILPEEFINPHNIIPEEFRVRYNPHTKISYIEMQSMLQDMNVHLLLNDTHENTETSVGSQEIDEAKMEQGFKMQRLGQAQCDNARVTLIKKFFNLTDEEFNELDFEVGEAMFSQIEKDRSQLVTRLKIGQKTKTNQQ
jgi:hypothetical protein